MKTLKPNLVLAIALLFLVNVTVAQDAPSMFVVHTDNVKFEKMQQYEQLAKTMKENCEKYKVKNMAYTAISIEDGRYVYVSAIKSMADLDKNPMAELSEKMDKDTYEKLFNSMDECYDSHSDKVIYHVSDLSYTPDNANSNTGNHREYHFLYYAPKNAKAMKEAMKKVKALYEKKGIKTGYEIYHSGFGSDKSYYMVSVSGESELEIAKKSVEEDKLMGDERGPTFYNVIKLTTKYDQVEGRVRPDLSYTPE